MDNKIPHILIVDDDVNLLATMSDILMLKGFEPVTAQTGTAALAQLEAQSFDLALIDLRLEDMSGLKVLSAIKARSRETECILLTGHASQDTAIRAIQMGAYGFFQKPFDMEQVLLSIQRANEKKQSALALNKSEQRYHGLFEDSPIAIWEEDFSEVKKHLDSLKQQGITDFHAYFASHPEAVFEYASLIKILDVNNTAVQMYEAESKEKLLESTHLVLTKGEQEHLHEDFIKIIEGKTSSSWEGGDETVTGRPIEVSLSWSVSPGHEDDFAKVIVTTIDITERKQAEKKLAQTEKHFRSLIENAPDGVVLVGMEGTYKYASPAALRIFGYSLEDTQGHNPANDTHPEDLPIVLQVLQDLITNPSKVPTIQYRFKHSDGSWRWVESTFTNLMAEPSVEAIVINFRDITESKQARDAQQESELQFRALFELSPDAVMLIDPYDPNIVWPIVDCNSAACLMNGYRRDELIGQSIDIVNVEPATQRNQNAYVKRIRELGSVKLETFHRHKNGTVFPIEVSTSLIKIGDRELMIGIDRDITERKRTELEIMEQKADLELIKTLNEAVNRGDSLNKVMELFAGELRKISVCKDSAIYLLNPDGKNLVMEYLSIPPALLKKIEQLTGKPLNQIQIPVSEGGSFQNILRSEQGAILTDPKSIQNRILEFTDTSQLPAALRATIRVLIQQIYKLLGIRSNLMLRLISNNKVIGLLEVSSSEILTEKDLSRVQNISNQLTAVILRKQAEEALLESEERYRSIFDGVQDAIFIESKDGRILGVNKSACEMYGYQQDEFVGKTVSDIIPEESRISLTPDIESNIPSLPLELVNRRANGDLFPVELNGKLQIINGEEILLVIVRDITERKRAEEALHESEQRFKDAFQYSAIGMALVSLDGKCLKVNSKLCSILGYSEDELLSRTIQDITHPDDLDIDLNYMNQLLSGEIKSYTMEKRYFTKEEKIVWVFLAVALATNHAGAPQYFISQINDITERKQSEVALRESEALYRRAIEVAGAVPYLQSYNNNGTEIHYDFIGEEIHQITGYRADEFTGVLWDSLIQESVLLGDLANYSMEEAIRRVRTGEIPLWKCEHLIRARDGNIRWVFETAVELYAENGTAKGSIGMFQDITERKQAEENIRQRVKELELLYESGLIFSQLLNPKEIAQKIIGLLTEKMDWHHTTIRLIRGRDELELVAFDQPGLQDKAESHAVEKRFRNLITRVGEGLSGWAIQQSRIVRLGDVNSDPHYIETYPGLFSGLYVPMKSANHMIGVISIESEKPNAFSETDEQMLATLANQAANAFENARLFQTTRQEINERKRVEKLLADERNQLAQRVEERTADLSRVNADLSHAVRVKDEFLASMSHELRTPLTGILGLSEVLQLKIYGELNERQSTAVKNIEESGRHLLELINDILDLSKIEAGKLELQFAAYSLTDICQASLHLIKGMAQHKHQQVHYSPPTEPIIVRADARRLKQLLVNLLSNAIKFTPENGELGLDVEANQSERKIRITVWDKGIGIKPEEINNIFKPFTQLDSGLAREYSGTGLGLSLVHHLTEMHNGGIEVESNIGQGSRFTIILPWSPQNTTPIPYIMQRGNTGSLSFPPHSKSPLVMYVDDNEMVLQMVSDFLESKQYRVMKVRSGLELLERAAEIHPNIMLVDIQMPGIGGMETIRRIRSHPDPVVAAAPVIAVTALAMPADRERCLRAGANDYMSKPLKLKELAATIQKLLERKQ